MSFTERLDFLINKHDVTHKDIEEKTGVSAGNISHYRTGKSKPGFDAIIALAKFFNVTTDWLLLGRELGEYQQHPGRVNHSEEKPAPGIVQAPRTARISAVQAAIDEDPAFAEWIDILLKLSPDARAMLLNINRPNLINTSASNPGNAPSTSTNTDVAEQHAAAKSDIA